MTENPECVTPETSLADAAQKMRDLDVGIIPVVDSEQGRRLKGVVTDRDITIRAVAEAMDARSTKVSEVMTTEVESCNKNDTVGDILRVMEREQVRRVPITDREGRLVGIVAQADVVRDLDSERGEHRVERHARAHLRARRAERRPRRDELRQPGARRRGGRDQRRRPRLRVVRRDGVERDGLHQRRLRRVRRRLHGRLRRIGRRLDGRRHPGRLQLRREHGGRGRRKRQQRLIAVHRTRRGGGPVRASPSLFIHRSLPSTEVFYGVSGGC
jgi:CBS domain-containing protein